MWGEEFSETGSNFLNCLTPFSRGGEKNFRGASPLLITGLGQSRDREPPTRLAQVRSSLMFVPLPAEAGCETF